MSNNPNNQNKNKKSLRKRHSLLSNNNIKWQTLNNDTQNLFYDKFNSIIRDQKNSDNKWFKVLFYTCINEILNKIKDISGIIINQKLISLGIGNHILIICKIENIPCIILSNNEEMMKWISNKYPISCIGIKKSINKVEFEKLHLNNNIYSYESIRIKLEELINNNKSSYEIPYLILNENNEFINNDFKIIPPIIKDQIVEPKIEYPKYMKRSERRKLRKERRKQILNKDLK